MSTPKQITMDINTHIEIAYFSYEEGKMYAKERNLCSTNSFGSVLSYRGYLLFLGDIVIRVLPEDFPEIPRKILL